MGIKNWYYAYQILGKQCSVPFWALSLQFFLQTSGALTLIPILSITSPNFIYSTELTCWHLPSERAVCKRQRWNQVRQMLKDQIVEALAVGGTEPCPRELRLGVAGLGPHLVPIPLNHLISLLSFTPHPHPKKPAVLNEGSWSLQKLKRIF